MNNETSRACTVSSKSSTTYLILFIATFFLGCGQAVKNDVKGHAPVSAISLHIGNEKYFPVDTANSVLTWKGSSLNGFNTQTGYVHISKGELMVESDELVGGTIEIDMNTIEDKNHKSNTKLVDHLKDPDFFEVEKFPFSTIIITRVSSIIDRNTRIDGNLTIKGITRPFTFPAQVEIKNGIVKATARLTIDRTLWDVRYKSAKFYSNLANQTMSDSIEFNVEIIANKVNV